MRSKRWTALVAVWLGMLHASAALAQAPGGQLTIAQGTDAVTMDPHNTTQMTAMQPFNFVYNKLINRDREMKLVPELAESWKALDELTWEIKLRKGVKFHNGEDFDAASVIAKAGVKAGGNVRPAGLDFRDLGIGDPLDVMAAHFRFEQAFGIAHACQAKVADIGLGGNEGHRYLVTYPALAQVCIHDEGEFIGWAKTTGERHGADDDWTRISD